MEQGQLKAVIEAMIFVAEEPLAEGAIVKTLEPDGIGKDDVRAAIAAIRDSFNADASMGLQLACVAGGFQFRTKEGTAAWVARMCETRPMKLSAASLETLAIIAYRQPIVRAEIEHIRGVDSGGVLKKLIERRLVRIVGKRDEPGQPLIYGTTHEFLELFGLPSLKDLPPLADLRDIAERRLRGQQGFAGEAPATEGSAVGGGNLSGVSCVDADAGAEDADSGHVEIIERLEHDEAEDAAALDNLEYSIKSVRRLEKAIFPKPVAEPNADGGGPCDASSNEAGSVAAAEVAGGESGAPECPAADSDAPEQADRPGE